MALAKDNTLPWNAAAVVPSVPRMFLPVLLGWGLALLVLGAAGTFGLHKGLPLSVLTRDPAAIMNAAFYTGAISSLGAVLWSATAGICFFTHSLLGRAEPRAGERSFLAASGLLTSLLLTDDLFQVHEEVVPNHLGVSEKVVLAAYALLALRWLYVYRATILAGDYPVLALALGCFAISVGIDQLAREAPTTIFLEDCAKFLGIVTWLTFFVLTSTRLARRAYGAWPD